MYNESGNTLIWIISISLNFILKLLDKPQLFFDVLVYYIYM